MPCQCILIVEDEEFIRDNLRMLFELEGYQVRTASNGKEGLQVLRELPHPCLVLLDLLMPVMNGMEFLEEKRSDDTILAIPVCVVSAVADRPLTPGATGFIKKPIDFEGLIQFVRKYCGNPNVKGPH